MLTFNNSSGPKFERSSMGLKFDRRRKFSEQKKQPHTTAPHILLDLVNVTSSVQLFD